MDTFPALLLDVWRAACQHTPINEAVERIAPLLVERLGVARVLVRRIDPQRPCVETIAGGGDLVEAGADRIRTACSPEAIEELLVWCRRSEIQRGPAEGLAKSLPGLLPEGTTGDVLAAPFGGGEGPPSILVAVANPAQRFEPEHEPLFRALLEPLAVALENDRRLRELTVLREAVEADNRSLRSRLGRHDISESIIGAESGLRAVMEQVELVARSDVPVLILGETGSGKEVVARAIHTRSGRASGPCLRVNCGALPPELIDSELFGHERGSFTGAVGVRKGWFERANGGTLFMDEVAELPLAAQVRLLRILQDGSFQRVGGETPLHVDVRIVAATHRDLQTLVASNMFREDLWYRLAVFPVHLPPLRDRQEDIPELAAHFARRSAQRLGLLPLAPSPEDIRLLLSYPWPGNVRELSAVIERAAILGNGRGLAMAQALGASVAPGRPPRERPTIVPAAEPAEFLSLDAAMVRHIEAALTRTRGRIEGPDGAAHLLGINPHTLRARMRKLAVNWDRFRGGTLRLAA